VKPEYRGLFGGMLFACLISLAADAPADEGWDAGESVPVCAAPGDQQSPAISLSDKGLLVVWQDGRPDGKKADTKYPWSVYGRHLLHPRRRLLRLKEREEFPIHVPPDSNALHPDVSGNTVVWLHNRGWSRLVMTTLEDGKPGDRKEIGDGSEPAIDGNLVVWASGKNRWDAGKGDIAWITDIRAFELDGPGLAFDVTNSAKRPEAGPAVSGSTVVWQEWCAGSSGWSSVFLRYRDIDRDAGGRRLAGIRDKKSVNAAIDDSFVVWQDDRNGDWDVYGFDVKSGEEREIYKGPGDQENPALHGSLVVWQDNRSGEWDIYGCDLTAGRVFPVFVGRGNQTEPAIYGDAVVWTDDRDGDKNIYMNQRKAGTRVR